MPGTTTERGARNRTATDFRSEALAGFYREAAKGSGPKRARLHRAMLKMIDHGFWNPGDRLPTDLELTERLPLSLATVQAALQLLADQEIVVRKKRNGTFVASEEHLSRMLIFFRFVDPDSVRPLAVEERERTVAETGERGPWSDFLGIRDRYVQWSRTLEIGGEFMVRSEFYFSNPRLRVLLDLPAESLKGIAIRPLLQVRFGLPTTGLDWQSAFRTFDEDLARMLGVRAGVIGQQYDVGLLTIGEEPLAYHRFWVPPNRYRMLISP